MKVFIEKDNRNISISRPKGCIASELMKSLGLTAVSTIIVRNGEVILEDEFLSDEDNVQMLSVVSGG